MRFLLLPCLALCGCVFLAAHDFQVQAGVGVQPALSWQGGPVGHVQISEKLMASDGGTAWDDRVFDVQGPLSGDRNVVSSPYTLGASLPEGALQYHPATNTWDTAFAPVSLTQGHHYVVHLGRYNPSSIDLAEVELTP